MSGVQGRVDGMMVSSVDIGREFCVAAKMSVQFTMFNGGRTEGLLSWSQGPKYVAFSPVIPGGFGGAVTGTCGTFNEEKGISILDATRAMLSCMHGNDKLRNRD